jgi:hypothetical protein
VPASNNEDVDGGGSDKNGRGWRFPLLSGIQISFVQQHGFLPSSIVWFSSLDKSLTAVV